MTKRSGLRVVSIHCTIDPYAPRAMPPKAMMSASDSISAATLPDVRRGAWMMLSAARAPSTARMRVRRGRSARVRPTVNMGPRSSATAIVQA